MKKIVLVFLVLISLILDSKAENKSVKDTLAISASQTDPWVKEAGLRYNMAILARVYKDNVLFQPTGALLGIFKDAKCWGYQGIGNSPVGPIFNVTMGYNNVTATGFKFKIYDATTKLTYDIVETVDFQDNTPVGLINAPISLHVSGLSGLNDVLNSQFSVCPNPVESEFKITLGSDTQKNTLIQLYNISGQLESVLYNGGVTINQEIVIRRESRLMKGIYFIKVNNGLKFSTQKIILK